MIRKSSIKQAGFTLIEALLVLFITCSLLCINLKSPKEIFQRIQLESALKQMESQISLLQQESFIFHRYTYVSFFGSKARAISFKSQNSSFRKIPPVTLPEPYYVKGCKSIFFNEKGESTDFFTLYILGPKTKIRYRFQLGAGRFFRDEIPLESH
ncbi:type II secretion system protein [Atopobacter sp. AH10]|uniref:competence type IV pilus minor pilin ComGD n=1 Tax=Atopobacter sp. AH10 TaxID=2315861 RepID=UPI000EF1CA64|nr:competence type IV pilus minor pilin ComGD [Atopobacter sp. AH10]RLK62535.1 type II secretion system protein [Atopobacter sp. AH10]